MGTDANGPPGGAGGSGGEHGFSSARSEFEWRKIRARRQAQEDSAAKPLRRWQGRVPWPRRKPLTITIKYRGGPECWVEVRARGDGGRFPGSTYLIDVCEAIWRDR